MASLVVSGVTVWHGGHRALDKVSLRAEPRRITGLIGPNGAGKSTLFDVVSGLRRPSQGRVVLGGRDVTRLGPSGRARAGLGRTFQRLELFDRLSVRDNVLVAAELGPDRHQAREIVDAVLDLLALTDVAGQPVHALPTGTARLVEIGRAVAGRPAVLLLDEPAAGQDRAETERFAGVLRRLAARGTAVVLVEHDVELVMDVCDVVHVLDLGQIIAVGPPSAVRDDERVRMAYLGVP